jgi:glycosyltransferase involved in cell wall biosynthesis
MQERNKTILYFPNLYPSYTGGMEIYNYYLYQELLERDFKDELIILTGCDKIINNRNILPLKNRLFFKTKYGLGALSTILYYTFSQKIYWRNIRTIYIPYTDNFEYNAIAFIILKKLFRLDYVVHIHSGDFKKSDTEKLQKYFLKNALDIAGVSKTIVQEYFVRAQRTIKFIPPLIPFVRSEKHKEVLRKEIGLDKYDVIILFVGSIKPLKAPEVLIEAFIELGGDFIEQHKVCLVIVGEGELRPALSNKYCKNINIRFMGKVPNEEIKHFYKIADIYVIPSWFEGTPLSLLEALFNKLVCVGTNVRGINNNIINGENGFLFEKDNVCELKQILVDIITSKKFNTQIGQKAYDFFMSEYSYSSHLQDIKNFINLQ